MPGRALQRVRQICRTTRSHINTISHPYIHLSSFAPYRVDFFILITIGFILLFRTLVFHLFELLFSTWFDFSLLGRLIVFKHRVVISQPMQSWCCRGHPSVVRIDK